MTLRRLVGIAILVCLSRRTCNRLQYSRARRPCRPFLAFQPIQPIRPVKASKSTIPRDLVFLVSLGRLGVGGVALVGLSGQVSLSILVILVCVSPLITPMGLHKLYILAIIFRISTVTRLGAAFRQVASVILVALLVLASTASLSRQRIPSILSIVGRLSARWPTTGYEMAGRIGRITIHPYDLGAKTGYYTRAPQTGGGADPGPPHPAGARSMGYPPWLEYPIGKYPML